MFRFARIQKMLEINQKKSLILMKPIYAHIDSFNFKGEDLEMLFMNNNYSIQTVKSISTFEPQIWLQTFGKSLQRHIIEAKIVHTMMGLTIPLKRFASSPYKQTIEFAGLHSYTEHSKLLCKLLNDLYQHIQDELITRVDVAIDFKGAVPIKVLKALKKSRQPFHYKNSCYMKTNREKATNPHINICIYPKHKKENLDYELERVEFAFKGSYFRGNYLVKDLDSAILKMQKSIQRFTGLKVLIKSL